MSRTPAQRLKAEKQKIQIARREIFGDDDAAYRAMLERVAGVTSSTKLDQAGRRAVLEHLKALGWKAKPAKRAGRVPHTLDRKAQLAKIEAQLTELNAPWQYADAIAQRVAQVDACAWLKTADQFAAVIAALEAEQKKRGYLAWIDKRLDALGWTHADIDARLTARRGRWQRHLPTLAQISDFLDAECGKQGIDLFALWAVHDEPPETG